MEPVQVVIYNSNEHIEDIKYLTYIPRIGERIQHLDNIYVVDMVTHNVGWSAIRLDVHLVE